MKDYLRASIPITKPILLIDMDGVICDFDKRAKELEEQGIKGHKLFRHPEAYKNLEPIEGAIEAWHELQEKYETYILSTPAWSNPDSWAEKRRWVEEKLGKSAHKKLILCHNKGLVKGDFLIDDRIANGVADFGGEHIHFGTENFPTWKEVLEYLGSDYSPYCKKCSSCGETGCCQPTICQGGEGCEYPKTNLNELKFGWSMNEYFQKEIYPKISDEWKKLYDAVWDTEWDRWNK